MLTLGLIATIYPEIWCGFTLQRVSPAFHISLQYLVYASDCSQFCHGSFIGNPVFPLTYRLNWPYINNMTDCLSSPNRKNRYYGVNWRNWARNLAERKKKRTGTTSVDNRSVTRIRVPHNSIPRKNNIQMNQPPMSQKMGP